MKLLSASFPCPFVNDEPQASKCGQDLAIFMEDLLDGVKRQEHQIELLSDGASISLDQRTEILGQISPHHHSNNEDSKSSSETSLTYSQLNYYETMNRFFDSRPATFAPDDSFQTDFSRIPRKKAIMSPMQVIFLLRKF